VTQSANAAKLMNRSLGRSIFRWIHLVFSIPILGYIYSPFDKIPNYAPATRYVFVPIMILSGLWLWKGHVVRRLISKFGRSQEPTQPCDLRSLKDTVSDSSPFWARVGNARPNR
jgi:hypothetical protein